jgi:hypothetical protein
MQAGKELLMSSPFPGMDPYLEGYLWPDVHHALIAKIRQQLAPRLRPRYVARVQVSIVVDNTPEAEIGIMYPDVEVIAVDQQVREAVAEYEVPGAETINTEPIPPAPLTIRLLGPIEVRLATVEIREVAHNELITIIEILSPVNKREPGLTKYRRKQQQLRQTGVHLLEIDLLRRGTRPIVHPRLPDVPYLITLTRAHTGRVEVWPIKLQDTLPIVPAPLRAPDPDIPLELSPTLAAVYDEAVYELSIDYTQPPPPPSLSSEEMAWLEERVRK